MRAIIDDKEYVDTVEAAEITSYTAAYIRRLIRKKKLVGTKRGVMWFIELESLEAYKRKMLALGNDKHSPHPD